MEWIAIIMFFSVVVVLLGGFPVAFSLGGVALIFATVGAMMGIFDATFLWAMPNRLFGIMSNETLMAVPLFVFMGVTLERAKIAESLLESLSSLFGKLHGGLGISVTLVGMLLAASTGIVGATVVTMGLLSLPTMLRQGYDQGVATGTICASGTLGQIIPPSIVLVLLGDVLSSAYSQAQIDQGIFSPDTVSVGDLFVGALIPGLMLVTLYVAYLVVLALLRPDSMPSYEATKAEKPGMLALGFALFPPLLLILAVLGSILAGLATPTEAAGVGAVGDARPGRRFVREPADRGRRDEAGRGPVDAGRRQPHFRGRRLWRPERGPRLSVESAAVRLWLPHPAGPDRDQRLPPVLAGLGALIQPIAPPL